MLRDRNARRRTIILVVLLTLVTFVGEAVRVWMHMDGLSWPRWDRIGLRIQ